MAVRVPLEQRAQRAKTLLILRRVSNRKVARLLDFSYGQVCAWLNGVRQPPPKFRRDLARLLGQPEGNLFRPLEPPGPHRCSRCGGIGHYKTTCMRSERAIP
jgi:transcriptional regulator with XRE-family HTH domain